MLGGVAFTGGPAVDEGWTTLVGLEFLLAVPSELVAMTRDRMVCPTSAAERT